MRRSHNVGRKGSRIAQQIVDRFLSRRSKDSANRASRSGRVGSLTIESLETRWYLSATPLAVMPDYLTDPGFEGPLGFDDDVLIALDSEGLGFDDANLYVSDGATGDATPTGTSYLVYEYWGGTWVDAEKTVSNTDDDLLCWAATASNILAWTGWGEVEGITTTDDIFAYFQEHWSDQGGIMEYGWDWWFDGTNTAQGYSGWAQVEVEGGGFYLSEIFSSYYHSNGSDSQAMATIESYLNNGYGVGLGVYGPGGHAITCWGYNYDPVTGDYLGIWVTDSDDSKSSDNPTDLLRYYEVEYSGGQWYLQDFYGSDSWYIGVVQGLEQNPGIDPTPDASEQTNTIEGTVYNDVNANGTMDQGESGMADQTVFLDQNHNGVLDQQSVTVSSADVAKAITDSSTITSTLYVSGISSAISDLNITLDITHSYTSDLTVYLISPEGTRVLLFSGIGGGGDNFTNTTLDDEAPTSIDQSYAPFSGTFQAQGLLSDFDGESANGTWTLEITDSYTYDEGSLNSWSIELDAGEISTTTAADGSYAFNDLEDGNYRVTVLAPTGWSNTVPASGYYNLNLSEEETADATDFGLSEQGEIEITELGTVDYAHLDQVNLSAGQYWYSLETTRAGYLTLAADVSSSSAVSVTLYDQNFNVLDTSQVVDGLLRVEDVVAAGETLIVGIRVTGSATVSDLYAVNLVQQSGNTVTVHGTSGDDAFEFDGSTYEITVNDITYDFTSSQAANVVFSDSGGSDSIVLNGGDKYDRLFAYPTSATLNGKYYTVSMSQIEDITLIGNGGVNKAYLYDSAGDDTFTANSTYRELAGDGFRYRVIGCSAVRAYATAGGNDTAVMYDTAGDEILIGKKVYTTLKKDGYYNRATGFDNVTVHATAGGYDRAYLYDSFDDDTFTASDSAARMLYGGGESVSIDYFDYVIAKANHGGNDTALLYDSVGNDIFTAKKAYSILKGDDFLNRANGFENVTAHSTAGGYDRAYFYDSNGDDHFIASETAAELIFADGASILANDFDWVWASSTKGGNDTKEISLIDYVLQTQGTWDN